MFRERNKVVTSYSLGVRGGGAQGPVGRHGLHSGSISYFQHGDRTAPAWGRAAFIRTLLSLPKLSSFEPQFIRHFKGLHVTCNTQGFTHDS